MENWAKVPTDGEIGALKKQPMMKRAGVDLFDYIKLRANMDESGCRDIFKQVVSTTHLLHTKALVCTATSRRRISRTAGLMYL